MKLTRHTSGFTLLEVLVVLVITSVVAGVAIGLISTVAQAQSKASSAITDVRARAVTAQRIRSVINGISVDYPDGPDMFAGSDAEISGLTVSPLFSPAGRPTPFNLRIEGGDALSSFRLVYQERDSEAITLMDWAGERGGFSYLRHVDFASTHSGEAYWQNQWNPNPDASRVKTPELIEHEPLPALIKLNLGQLGSAMAGQTVIASVTGAKMRLARSQDIEKMFPMGR